MSIEKKCENCGYYHKIDDEDYCNCMGGSHYERPCVENNLMFFRPSENAIREDEKNKIITLLNSDLETLDLSEHDNMLLNENSAVANYIKSVKALLEKEK